MNTICVAFFVTVLAVANASLLAGHGVGLGAVLAGPSGTVIRSGGLLGAPVAAVHAAPIAVAAPVAVGAVPLAVAQKALELSVPAGSGLEGQWIPDINEKLYDDGQIRAPLRHAW